MEPLFANGIQFVVLETLPDGRLVVSRPNGSKRYLAQRLPDHPLYGQERGKILGPYWGEGARTPAMSTRGNMPSDTPSVREILIELTVVDHEAGNVLAALGLDEQWPDCLIGVRVVRERAPRAPTPEEAESMCWTEDEGPGDPDNDESHHELR